MNKLAVLDLFSGIGGFSLGLERTGGFETVAFCEIEEYPRQVLAKHWPNVPCYRDVRELTADRLAADGIAVDVITGGFPCQDISTAGKGAGLAGERSGLWSEIARLVGELAPRFVIVENVAALLSRGLGTVLGDLASLGYDAEWHCIPASAVGAPHRRDRVWIVAYPNRPFREGARVSCGVQSGNAGSWKCSAKAAPLADTSFLQRDGSELHGEHGQCAVSKSGTRGSAGDVADAISLGRQGQGQPILASGQAPFLNRQAIDAVASSFGNIWRVEPDVGGGPDGFPAFLDRYVGRGLTYAKSQRAIQALRELWNEHVSRSLRRTIGGFDRLQQAEVLFAFLRQYESGSDEARVLVEGEEASEAFLRSLRGIGEAASAPHRPRQVEQCGIKHPDAVQVLPRLLAFNSAPHWAGSGWEDAVARVAHGVPDRAHRLKGLGNAVVPQIPELIGNAILQAIGRTT